MTSFIPRCFGVYPNGTQLQLISSSLQKRFIFYFYHRIVPFPYLLLISCMPAQDSFCSFFYHKISFPSCVISSKSCTKLLRKSQHIFAQGRMLVVLETLTGYITDFLLSVSPLEHMGCFASTYCNEELQPQKNKILSLKRHLLIQNQYHKLFLLKNYVLEEHKGQYFQSVLCRKITNVLPLPPPVTEQHFSLSLL